MFSFLANSGIFIIWITPVWRSFVLTPHEGLHVSMRYFTAWHKVRCCQQKSSLETNFIHVYCANVFIIYHDASNIFSAVTWFINNFSFTTKLFKRAQNIEVQSKTKHTLEENKYQTTRKTKKYSGRKQIPATASKQPDKTKHTVKKEKNTFSKLMNK